MPVVRAPQTELPEMDCVVEHPAELDDPHIPDCDRILRLLEANGGTLWQTQLVDALDVSKATVSRRLSDLEDSTQVSRLLFRGQKLVWLQDDAPAFVEPAHSGV